MSSSSVPSSSVVTKAASSSSLRSRHAKMVSFRLASKPKLPLFSSKVSRLNCSTNKSSAVIVTKAQLNEVVGGGGSSNDSAAVGLKPVAPASSEGKDVEPSAKESTMSEEAISEFMTQAASLVKLVDSRDIVELQLRQLGCELIIRKKEALIQTPAPAPVIMMHSHPPPAGMPPQYAPPPPAAPAVPGPAGAVASPAPSMPPPPAKPTKSSHPPLKSPMAGTFYRSPGPGQPPFVKVGDKVSKGQVLCIIEAMKLMNEIEADQAGTVVEILLDDVKPVGIDQPLFVIEP